MAEPISIIGTAGALANIVQLATQTITAIRDLRSDWKDTDLTLLSITGQLSALRLALTKIEEWMAVDPAAHHQLVMDLDDSIRCCNILLTKLQELVDSLEMKQNNALYFQSKLKLVFGKKSIGDIQSLLEHQTNALNLLLSAFNCKTGAEQHALLTRSNSRRMLRQTNLDAASLRAQYDRDSITSQLSDTFSRFSLRFSFDREVFGSNVYEQFFRQLTRSAYKQPENNTPPAKQDISVGEEWRLFTKRLLIIGYEYSGVDDILHNIADELGDNADNFRLAFQQMAVYRFVILTMKAVVTSLNLGGANGRSGLNPEHCAFLLQYMNDTVYLERLDARVGEVIRSLWMDPCMESVRRCPQDFDITDSGLHLFNDLDRVLSPQYKPTPKDIQTVRHRTPAIIQLIVDYRLRSTECERECIITGLEVRDVTLRFRSNKPYSFDNIATIYLPVDVSVYDKVLEGKNPSQTALVHCISRLKTTLQSAWLPHSNRVGILLSEHQDLAPRLEARPFSGFYPGYSDDNNPDAIYRNLSRELVEMRPVAPLTASSTKGISTVSFLCRARRLGLGALLSWSELLLRLQQVDPEWVERHIK
ncbi:hypothetical protein BJX68DRAFT_273399 [Aspergillus pseudodeflectus]|uniref:Fungal N-terminal domain-containing protein n=1 Tax=Aspergillus pseudodeflectus TaxID=176178 RepID=A0ABR4J9G5_9EURO